MEYLFDSGGKLGSMIDEWIQVRDSSTLLFPENHYRKYKHTVYTYLRDNVHYKKESRLFPVEEIEKNLPNFHNLVKQRIAERFNIDV